MPIRYVDRSLRVARIVATFEPMTATMVGAITTPASRIGTIASNFAPLTASIAGFFTPAISRTGTISVTLGPLTGALTGTHVAPATWATVPTMSFTQGVAATISFAAQAPAGSSSYIIGTSGQTGVANTSKIAELTARGITLDSANKRMSYDGVGTAGSVSNVILEDVATASADWQARISDPGVVWYHNFDTASEVNQFRWTNGYASGNDPNSVGSGSNYVTHQASGGVDGGGFMRLTYPLGSAAGRGNSYWQRPFNPLTGAGNGRWVDDPGAGGTISPVAFPVSDGSSTTYGWGNSANPGWYMHASHQASYPGKFQGTDFWLQVRVRRAQMPGAPPDSAQYSNITGKNVWLTTTNGSYTAQELVTYGQSASNAESTGLRSRHNIYSGQNFTSLSGGQPNATVTLANTTIGWRFSGGWDTLLYHITPGTNGGTGDNRTRVEAWVAHDGETVYTKIWDVTYTQGFDLSTNSVGAPGLPGWNALILAIYHNGSAFTTTAFDFDYDQVIFSKAYIACPQV